MKKCKRISTRCKNINPLIDKITNQEPISNPKSWGNRGLTLNYMDTQLCPRRYREWLPAHRITRGRSLVRATTTINSVALRRVNLRLLIIIQGIMGLVVLSILINIETLLSSSCQCITMRRGCCNLKMETTIRYIRELRHNNHNLGKYFIFYKFEF